MTEFDLKFLKSILPLQKRFAFLYQICKRLKNLFQSYPVFVFKLALETVVGTVIFCSTSFLHSEASLVAIISNSENNRVFPIECSPLLWNIRKAWDARETAYH